jgi:predicted nucleotidyltransferase
MIPIARAREALATLKDEKPNIEILFASIGGSHLYGWSDDNSDVDVRGCYIFPTEMFWSMEKPPMTVEMNSLDSDCDQQLHEIEKFLGLLISPNLNIIENLCSPAELYVTPPNEFTKKCLEQVEKLISKQCYPHIQGLVTHMKRHVNKYNMNAPKRRLYIFRELMRGIVLFEDGVIESNINQLAKSHLFKGEEKDTLNYLIELKKAGNEIPQEKLYQVELSQAWLESMMLRAKEFGGLKAEPADNQRRIASNMLREYRTLYTEM